MRTGHRGGTQNENKVSRIPSTTQSRNTSSQSIQPTANKRRRAIDATQSLVDKVTAPTQSSAIPNSTKKINNKSKSLSSVSEYDFANLMEADQESIVSLSNSLSKIYQESIVESQTSAPRSLRSRGGPSLSIQATLLNSLRGLSRVPQGFAADILADTEKINALIGVKVKKLFEVMNGDEDEYYTGVITQYFPNGKYFHVVYVDDDEEDLSCSEVCEAIRLYVN